MLHICLTLPRWEDTCINIIQSSRTVFWTPLVLSEDHDETTHWFLLGEAVDWILRK